MKKKQFDYFNKIKHYFIFLPWLLTLLMFFSQLNAQTASVQGRISSLRVPVQDARITFIDKTDTTIKFSTFTDAKGNYQIDILTSVKSNTNNIPGKFELAQNYPNPFSFSTAIPYQLKRTSDVKIAIYDVLGREVRKFTLGVQPSGAHSILWDGLNNAGDKVANGVYFYRFQAGDESKTGKMIFNSVGKRTVSLPRISSSQILKINEAAKQNMRRGEYTVRIENTKNTFPVIISSQVDNIQVKNDTTIYFYVDFIASTSIDLDSVHQIIRGFGAANIAQWRPDMTNSEIETAFGTGEGQLGFTILRLRIQPQQNVWSTNIATARKAHEMGALIFASPWSPPASMKTNSNTTGGELKESSYADFASHLNAFTDYMSNKGVPLYAISLQNEPDIQVNYESCDWSPLQMTKFIREHGAAIHTKIIAPESFQFRRSMSDPILNDSLACANLDIVGGHIYGGGYFLIH